MHNKISYFLFVKTHCNNIELSVRKKTPGPKCRVVVKQYQSKKSENFVFSRGGVTSVTPFPLSSVLPEG